MIGKVWQAIVRSLKYAIPIVISVGLCWYLFRNMDFVEMYGEIRNNCDFTYILLSMVLGVGAFFMRAIRWRLQLRASNINAPFRAVLYSIIGTYAVNIVFPRLGELWRSEYIARRQKAPFATVFGSMLADRVADMVVVTLFTVLTFLLAGSALKGFVENYPALYQTLRSIVRSPWTYIILATVVISIWLLMHKGHGRLIERARNAVRELVGGFMAIFHIRGAGLWVTATAFLWLFYLLEMLLVFYAYSYTREIFEEHGMLMIFVTFTLSCISMGVPSNGGFGPYQLAVMFSIACFVSHPDEMKTGAFANLLLGSQTLVFIVCGLVAFVLIAIDNRRQARLQKRQQKL